MIEIEIDELSRLYKTYYLNIWYLCTMEDLYYNAEIYYCT